MRESAQAPPAERMLRAAAELVQTGGIEAASTRAVAAAAGVQPPMIYRQFGDKDGLLDDVARFVLQSYIDQKRLLVNTSEDPAAELRQLWDLHVEFGLAEPNWFVLTYGQARPGRSVPAAVETIQLLRDVIARLGDQGRLRMSVERATIYFHSAGTGFVLAQIGLPPAERDPELSSIVFDNTFAAVTSDTTRPRRRRTPQALPGRAVALREALHDHQGLPLTAAETELLAEWLNRLADYVPVPSDAV